MSRVLKRFLFLRGHVNFQGGCLVIALWIYGRNPAKLIEIP